MLIELNGMWFHLSMRRHDNGPGVVASIVDEAFVLQPESRHAHTLDDVIGLVEKYAGIRPTPKIRRQVATRLASLLPPFAGATSNRVPIHAPG